jgi:hypothetical protein
MNTVMLNVTLQNLDKIHTFGSQGAHQARINSHKKAVFFFDKCITLLFNILINGI